MNISIFTPYGPLSQESGLLYLLANFVAGQELGIYQLRCNGSFANCERDAETNWRRDFSQCFQCIADQQHLQNWSGIRSQDISQYLTPDLVEGARRILANITAKQLLQVTYQDIDLSNLCLPVFKRRIESGSYDPENKRHEQVFRSLLASAIRMVQISNSFIEQARPDLIFIPKSTDILSSVLAVSALKYKIELVSFFWEVNSRSVIITKELSGQSIATNLVPEGVANMRSDRNTWPIELTKSLDEIAFFLGLQEAQLSLPIGRSTASAA